MHVTLTKVVTHAQSLTAEEASRGGKGRRNGTVTSSTCMVLSRSVGTARLFTAVLPSATR